LTPDNANVPLSLEISAAKRPYECSVARSFYRTPTFSKFRIGAFGQIPQFMFSRRRQVFCELAQSSADLPAQLTNDNFSPDA
jgi:hypothetical protein